MSKEHGKNYKRRVHKLDAQYREKILAYAAEKNSEWLAPAAVLYATGCRVEELKSGVKVSFDFESEEFIFEICGAKVNADLKRGIELREVRRKIENEHALLALMQVVALGSEVSVKSKAGFGNSIARASRALFARRKEQASPYSFRHSLASDMKTAGLNEIVIAGVLGHQSTASQSRYGRKRKNGGSEGIEIAAATSCEIRKVSPLARFKKRSSLKATTQQKSRGRGMSL
jgi:integrase